MDQDEPQPRPQGSRILTLPQDDDAAREPQAPIVGRAESGRIFAEDTNE